jgi:hypothetical protein
MSTILKYVKNGIRVHGPPYTKEEEADLYSRNANGPVTIARGAGGRKERKSQATQRPSPAAPGIREQPRLKRTRTVQDFCGAN